MPIIQERMINQAVYERLKEEGVPALLARVWAGRGVLTKEDVDTRLLGLLSPHLLTNNEMMAVFLADSIEAKKRLLVIGDYDADGATATAVAVRGLRSMGADVDFLVPNRFEYGYGLTPEIVDLASQHQPDIIVTVDNGIASVEGVARANALGIPVLVTDHHLPGDELPEATCIVNPNQPSCSFPSKHLAGVGVMFYVLMALRAEQRKRGLYQEKPEPNLSELLDIVALGTVADVVKLDKNNRILVDQGLRRIRTGQACAGIRALIKVSGREASKVHAQDLGFSLGPRLNAAGRLDDMRLGIACLITDEEHEAIRMAQVLHELNQTRRQIESSMQDDALKLLQHLSPQDRYSLTLFQSDFHQGVIGILASRVKEHYHRPTIVFADAGDGLLKGSGRSIPGLHLRDALDLVSKREPDLIVRFGGHAMAAGLTIRAEAYQRFVDAFERVVQSLLTPSDLESIIEVDGSCPQESFDWADVQRLEQAVWGQGFAPPLFCDDFYAVEQRIVGEKHLKLRLKRRIWPQETEEMTPPSSSRVLDAIFFGRAEPLPDRVRLVYQLQTNEFNGARSVQLNVRYAEAG